MAYKQGGINKYGILYDASLIIRKLFKAIGLKLNFCEVDTFIQFLYYKRLKNCRKSAPDIFGSCFFQSVLKLQLFDKKIKSNFFIAASTE